MLADVAKERRIESFVCEEAKHRSPAIVARRIVRGAGETIAAGGVRHAMRGSRGFERAELAVPACHHWAQVTSFRQPKEAVAFAELAVFVAAAHYERIEQILCRERQRHDVELVVDVEQQMCAMPPAPCCHLAQAPRDAPRIEEHRGNQHERGPIIDGAREARRERVERTLRHAYDLEPFFCEPIELTPDGVELAVGGNEPRPPLERQRGEQTHDQLVRIRRQRHASAGAPQQPCEAVAHELRLRERMLPFVVDVPCGVEPGILVRLERLVGPGLMRVAGQQQAFRNAEPRVERRERVRGGVERRRIHVTAPCESPTDPGTAAD